MLMWKNKDEGGKWERRTDERERMDGGMRQLTERRAGSPVLHFELVSEKHKDTPSPLLVHLLPLIHLSLIINSIKSCIWLNINNSFLNGVSPAFTFKVEFGLENVAYT